MKKVFYVSPIILALGFGLYFFSGSDDKLSVRELNKIKSQSLQKAVKAKANSPLEQNLADLDASLDSETNHALTVATENYQRNLNSNQIELRSKLTELKQDRVKLLKTYRERGVKIPKILKFEVPLLITLAYHFETTPGQINTDDFFNINLNSRQWYLLKTFSSSNEFNILLERGELGHEFTNFERLETIY